MAKSRAPELQSDIREGNVGRGRAGRGGIWVALILVVTHYAVIIHCICNTLSHAVEAWHYCVWSASLASHYRRILCNLISY